MSKKLEPHYYTPSLEPITVRGKYEIPETDFGEIYRKVLKELKGSDWVEFSRIGESMAILLWEKISKNKLWQDFLKTIRSGIPVYLGIITIEHHKESS